MLHDISEIENEQDQEAYLEVLLIESPVVLNAQRSKEHKVVEEVAQKGIKLLLHVFPSQFLIDLYMLLPLNRCEWPLIRIIQINLYLFIFVIGITTAAAHPINLIIQIVIITLAII